MRSEIGSEFWDIPLHKEENGLFSSNTAWFLSGRDALRAVIRDIRARRHFCAVAMPSWCCDSMIRPFLEEGVEVRFYPVYPGEDGSFIQELSSVRDCDGLLLMDAGQKTAMLHPASDRLDTMEERLAALYGQLTLTRVKNRDGIWQLVMVK